MKISDVSQAARHIQRLSDLSMQRKDLQSGCLELRVTIGDRPVPKMVIDQVKIVVDRWLATEQRGAAALLEDMGVTDLPEVA